MQLAAPVTAVTLRETIERNECAYWLVRSNRVYTCRTYHEIAAYRVAFAREWNSLPASDRRHRHYQEKIKLYRVVPSTKRSLRVRVNGTATKRPCMYRVQSALPSEGLTRCCLPARVLDDSICIWHIIRRGRAVRRTMFILFGRKVPRQLIQLMATFVFESKTNSRIAYDTQHVPETDTLGIWW